VLFTLSAAAALLRPPPLNTAALLLDLKLGLQERCSALLEAPEQLAIVLARDLDQALDVFTLRKAAPLTLTRWQWLIPVTLALSAIVPVALPRSDPWGLFARAYQQQQEAADIAREASDAAPSILQPLAELETLRGKLPQLSEHLDLPALLEQLHQGETNRQQALTEMAKAAAELDRIISSLAAAEAMAAGAAARDAGAEAQADAQAPAGDAGQIFPLFQEFLHEFDATVPGNDQPANGQPLDDQQQQALAELAQRLRQADATGAVSRDAQRLRQAAEALRAAQLAMRRQPWPTQPPANQGQPYPSQNGCQSQSARQTPQPGENTGDAGSAVTDLESQSVAPEVPDPSREIYERHGLGEPFREERFVQRYAPERNGSRGEMLDWDTGLPLSDADIMSAGPARPETVPEANRQPGADTGAAPGGEAAPVVVQPVPPRYQQTVRDYFQTLEDGSDR